MNKSNQINFVDKLKTKIQKAGTRAPVTKLRTTNIQWIKKLPRKGLDYQKKERQILIHTTNFGERLFIQYPGKESRKYNKNGKKRVTTAIRPWDFRPILYKSNSNNPHQDMSFGMMWATIFETTEKITRKNRKEIIRMLAILLYRMAFMIDHQEIEIFKTIQREIKYRNNDNISMSGEKKIQLTKIYKYRPQKNIVGHISKICPKWGNISFEAFLFYNELLSWNEDCKYFYRNFHVKSDAKWITSTGRINTLLTHIRILGYMSGDIPLSEIFDDFARRKGISPANDDETIRICGMFIKTE